MSWRVDSAALLLLCIQVWFLAPTSGGSEVCVNSGPGSLMPIYAFLGHQVCWCYKSGCVHTYMYVYDRRETPYFKKNLHVYVMFFFFLKIKSLLFMCIVSTLSWMKSYEENFECLYVHFKKTRQGYCVLSFFKTQNCSLNMFSCSSQYSS